MAFKCWQGETNPPIIIRLNGSDIAPPSISSSIWGDFTDFNFPNSHTRLRRLDQV